MNKLIYFPLNSLTQYDQSLMSDEYQYSKWFNLMHSLEWPTHTTSRVHQLNTPWPLAETICPIPAIDHNELNFEKVIESIADKCSRAIIAEGKTPYICWSGGIDSTSILVSLLKVASKEFLEKLIVLHNKNSVLENPYFYHHYIKDKLLTQDLDTFKVTASNHNNIVILDGEAGNQCMGWRSINSMAYYREFDMLDTPWRTIPDLKQLFPGSNDFNIELIKSSIPYAPVDIITAYDFIWWANFNFKFDDVLLRKIISYTSELTPSQSKTFWNNSLYRFYARPEMQVWSMLSKDIRREKTRIVSKYFPKKYIYDFDKNDLWFANKKEEGSDGVLFTKFRFSMYNPIIAIDEDWVKYSIKDSSTRQYLGKILQRI